MDLGVSGIVNMCQRTMEVTSSVAARESLRRLQTPRAMGSPTFSCPYMCPRPLSSMVRQCGLPMS